MAGYSKKQVAELTELTPRLIQFYTERKVVLPELDAGKGRGKIRRYSKTNLIEFGVIKQLADFGMTVKKIEEIIRLIRTIKPNRPVKMSHALQTRDEQPHNDPMDFISTWEGIEHIYFAIFSYGSSGFKSRVAWGESPKFAIIGLGDLFTGTLHRMESVMIINFGRIMGRYKML